jgi:GT2 family glycosyltransferase
MQVSVIILNYNVKYFLENCILSVVKAIKNIEAEIIVVDNNSTDGSCDLLIEKFPFIKLIKNTDNVGFSVGNNIGIQHAKGEFLYILNPDTVIAEDTIIKLIEFYNSTSNVGAIGCKMIDGTGNFLPESKRGVPTPWVSLTKFFVLYKFFPKINIFNQYYLNNVDEFKTSCVDILTGANMFLKRDLFFSVGGFDEGYFMYAEDTDLSYSIKQTGLSNYYFAASSIIHYKGESTIKNKIYVKRFKEAIQYFYRKHFKPSLLFDFFMYIGTLMFLFVKPKKTNQSHIISNYIVISKKMVLHQQIESFFKKNVITIAEIDKNKLNSQLEKMNGNTQIVFDANDFSYHEIISAMEQLKNKNITFKINPPQTEYIIGSNSSIDRGEVIDFANNKHYITTQP